MQHIDVTLHFTKKFSYNFIILNVILKLKFLKNKAT